jgi:hypothetical protein
MNNFRGYTHSEGQVVMHNNINGTESDQRIGWLGDVANKGKNKADIKFSTDWNGKKTSLNLKNAELTTLSQNPKFKGFFTRLSKARKNVAPGLRPPMTFQAPQQSVRRAPRRGLSRGVRSGPRRGPRRAATNRRRQR